ncbi:peptidoglycan editing factor PgeF [Brachybacterium sp. EF45031]|nr:peptidoglycan editing factor PgeF [Brachybacterium sillae]
MRGARALFTSRAGGEGPAPFDGLNLALHVGDDPAVVHRHRLALEAEVGVPVTYLDQVHSADVVVVRSGDDPRAVRTADAQVTRRTDVALAVMVADCLPVLLADGDAGVIAVAHAGRRGLLDGVLENTVAVMQQEGARPERLEVAIGPAICGACYEVPDRMREDAARTHPATAATTRWGTPGLDLRAGAVEVLRGQGIPAVNIRSDAPCTLEDGEFFSYRRASRTGRFAGVIRRSGSSRAQGDAGASRGDVRSA